MKKYLILLALTAVSIAGICAYAVSFDKNTVTAEIYELKETEVSDIIDCEGTVEQTGEDSVFVDMPVVVEKINYEIGDYVAKGDAIMNVDVAATYAMLAAGTGMSDYYSGDVSQEIISTYGIQGLSVDTSEVGAIPDKICAPKSGILTGLNAEKGEVAGIYGSVAVISDLTELQVKVSIDEKDVPKVEMGQSVQITGDGFIGSYTGTVKKLYPAARQKLSGALSETVLDAVVSIDNADEGIKPGFNVTAEIDAADKAAELILPYECIRQDEDGQEYVYVYTSMSAKRVNIMTGQEYSNGTVVLSGLKAGEQIITNPDDIPGNGARVKSANS